jgi:hypothetical protein
MKSLAKETMIFFEKKFKEIERQAQHADADKKAKLFLQAIHVDQRIRREEEMVLRNQLPND